MSSNKSDLEIHMTIIRLTSMAIFADDGDREVWLPLSQIEYDEDCAEGDSTMIAMPEWLAIEKELV